MRVIIENVRTLQGRTEVPIRPITILTGENSSGKSSLLAVIASVFEGQGFPFQPGFNRPPYSLGNFDTIATYKGGRAGRAKTFTIGYAIDGPPYGPTRRFEATYRERNGQLGLATASLVTLSSTITIASEESSSRRTKATISLVRGEESFSYPVSIPRRDADTRGLSIPDLLFYGGRNIQPKQAARRSALIEELDKARWFISPFRPESVAPVRSRPERTYGLAPETEAPEGEHVPFVLEELYRENSAKARLLRQALVKFGHESGLFLNLAVRQLGQRKAGDPFQLLVAIAGPNRNLIDVGYGVSQALPIVVQSVLASRNDLLLLQQPEVHLHPRAQAALGSFFVDLVRNRSRHFVIETHSDFIIDRIRQEVAAGRMKPEDVCIHYFRREGMTSTVHTLSLDSAGNIVGAPPEYRSFFLQEEMSLMFRQPRK